MNIRPKLVLLVASLFAVMIAVETVIQQTVLMPSFDELERADAQTAMTRIGYAVDRTLDGMESAASDWADWGELYQFMQDRNPGFIATYTTPVALAPLKVTVLLLIDGEGNVVFSSSRDLASGKPVDVDLAAMRSLPTGFPWRMNLSSGKAAHGMMRTDQGVMMLVEAPILDGSGGGRPRGMALMGRLLTAEQVRAIGNQAQASLFMLDAPRPPSESTLVEAAGITHVYRSYPDIYGNPLMTLEVDVPRMITARGHSAVQYSSWYLVGAAVSVLILLLLVFNRVILEPISRVTRHAVAVGEGADLSARLNFSGSDEIGQLAGEFDRMVKRLAESRASLVDQSFQAGFAELAKGILHNLGNAMTPFGVRLAALGTRLRAAPLQDLKVAAAELVDGPNDMARRADIIQLIGLGSRELTAMLENAQRDIQVMERQTSIVSATLAEQMASSRSEPVVERVALPDLLSQALDIVPDTCRQRLAIEADASLRAVGSVPVARTLLRLVLQNLIINAADAVDQSRREKGVLQIAAAIETDEDTQRLHLRCTDNGIGIAPENLARIFEKGFSTKSRAANHGIGLHWCANAIRSLGGRIWASSQGPGTGASLHVVLPVAMARGAGPSPSAAAA
jgi:sensor domain CHASE-containing protein